MPDPKKEVDPALVEEVRRRAEGAWAALYGADPKMQGVELREMTPWNRWWYGGPQVAARHSSLLPWQNDIYYDAEQIARHGMNPAETIEHEATHVQQRQDMGYLGWLKALLAEGSKAYGAGPIEGGALVAENELYKKMPGRDVRLPKEKK